MDASLLTNYYNQAFFELYETPGYDLPGAIYLDGLDVNGTIRTGPQLFGPAYGGVNEASQPGVINGTAKYAYVDTMLLATVRRLCGLTGAPGYGADMLDEHAMAACDQYIGILQAQRALYPLQQWMDPPTGRFMLPPPITARN